MPIRPVSHDQQRHDPELPGLRPKTISPGQKLSDSPSAVASQAESASSILVTRSFGAPGQRPGACSLRGRCCVGGHKPLAEGGS
ncbi:hypothetical protein SGPA1_50471 [Streptomyces misionensis JCM 4497]